VLALIVLLKTTLQGGQYEKRKLLPIKGDSAGGILALTIGRALPNRYQLLVERGGLLCWLISGVWTMRELEQFLNVEAEWVMDKYSEAIAGSTERTYYQGRIDQLAQVRRYLGQPQIMRERESK
jgi:hypothetical protein